MWPVVPVEAVMYYVANVLVRLPVCSTPGQG